MEEVESDKRGNETPTKKALGRQGERREPGALFRATAPALVRPTRGSTQTVRALYPRVPSANLAGKPAGKNIHVIHEAVLPRGAGGRNWALGAPPRPSRIMHRPHEIFRALLGDPRRNVLNGSRRAVRPMNATPAPLSSSSPVGYGMGASSHSTVPAWGRARRSARLPQRPNTPRPRREQRTKPPPES